MGGRIGSEAKQIIFPAFAASEATSRRQGWGSEAGKSGEEGDPLNLLAVIFERKGEHKNDFTEMVRSMAAKVSRQHLGVPHSQRVFREVTQESKKERRGGCEMSQDGF